MKRVSIVLFSFIWMLFSATSVFAGEINSSEQKLYDKASGTFSYDGKTYEAYGVYLDEAYQYLCKDNIDLSENEVQDKINTIENPDSIEIAIECGYIYEISSDDTDREYESADGTAKTYITNGATVLARSGAAAVSSSGSTASAKTSCSTYRNNVKKGTNTSSADKKDSKTENGQLSTEKTGLPVSTISAMEKVALNSTSAAGSGTIQNVSEAQFETGFFLLNMLINWKIILAIAVIAISAVIFCFRYLKKIRFKKIFCRK